MNVKENISTQRCWDERKMTQHIVGRVSCECYQKDVSLVHLKVCEDVWPGL